MQTTKQWWEECHRDPGNLYISDYGGTPLWKAMKIERHVRRAETVLEIGVGDGANVIALSAAGKKVFALDISSVALAKVGEIVHDSWFAPEDLPAGFFDLVISHLVTQHIDNATLMRQVENVLRSMRSDGLFALQFAEKTDGSPYRETLDFQQGGGVCRTPEMMREIVGSCKGRIKWLSKPIDFPKYQSRWFYTHIVASHSWLYRR